MYYIGIDTHKKYSQISVMDEQGKIVERAKVVNQREELQGALREYTEAGAKAVMESGWNWGLVYDILSEEMEEMKVAHPLKVKAIAEARIKTDKISADTLAHLLRANLIPECYVRSRENQTIQQVLRQRMFLVRMQTMVKNRIKNFVDRQENVREQADGYTDLFGTKGMVFLRSAGLAVLDRQLLDEHLELLEEIRSRIRSVEAIIEQLKQDDSVVRRLESIPGIGKFLGMLIRQEIDDVGRFKTSDKLCGYAGLVPSTYSSGGKTFHGGIIKQGNKFIRWAMIEAVSPAVRSDVKLRAYYESIKVKKGYNVAKVATARRLLKIVYQVWKEGRFYQQKTSNRDCSPLLLTSRQ